ncbi:MAG TPA: hydroxymethylbilane synthase [Vicinamibacterales bacterium]|nr:hydroxymethylbilane synthase [Vicinamibacterales bacterium]
MKALRLGTRGSALALWQARTVAALIESSATPVEIVVIRTTGDRLQQAPLSEVGGKRLFVKEIEDALLDGAIDLAVHSAKDMSAVLPDGLEIAAVLPREDPRDAVVLPAGRISVDFQSALRHLEGDAVIGTGSVRRAAQLAMLLPRARFAGVRGNVDTRLRKLDNGDFDALVLAAAGLHRLELAARISAVIPIESCVPAPGQGIVAIEIRSTDAGTRQALSAAGCTATAICLTAERTVVTALGGGCQLPLGAIALHGSGELRMHGLVASVDGSRVVRREVTGSETDPAGVGLRLADALSEGGAMEILGALRDGMQAASGGQRTAGHE